MRNPVSGLAEFAAEFLAMPLGPAPDPGMAYEAAGPVCRYVGKGTETHCYSLSFARALPRGARLDALIAGERRRAGRRKHEWKEYAFPRVRGLEAALAAAGYVVDRRSRLLFAPVERELPGRSAAVTEAVRGEKGLRALEEIGRRAWGEPAGGTFDSIRRELRRPEPLVDVFLARLNGKAASGGWVKYYHRVAFLFGGATLPECRGRGAYRALVAARMSCARRRGMRFVVSECSPDSERVLRGLGFLDAGAALRHVLAA